MDKTQEKTLTKPGVKPFQRKSRLSTSGQKNGQNLA